MMDSTDQGTPLPPHGPANMMSLYMTQYDYDYNREGEGTGDGGGAHDGAFEPGVSGDVRNRPIFAYGTAEADRDARTIYQVDYTGKDRGVKDLQGLAASLKRNPGVSAAVAASAGGEKGTGYQREWYRAGLTPSERKEDGTLPQTAYQEDYVAHGAGPSSNTTTTTSGDAPPTYAGAAAAAYNADLLKPHGVREDDGADIAPKITSRESLLPKGWTATFDGSIPPASTVTRSAGPSSTLGPLNAAPGVYTCTSWDIGDTSRAYPSQLPVSLAHSIAATGVDVASNPDKAALLRQLAGRGSAQKSQRPGEGTLRNEHDRTNPQLLSAQAQKTSAVSRRLEEERHVHMSMYRSDYVDQGQLPELPGNPAGPADVRDTQASPTATAGEMMAGQLTKSTRDMGELRNSHGTLTSKAAALSSMRETERAIAIDRADPHRHKLH